MRVETARVLLCRTIVFKMPNSCGGAFRCGMVVRSCKAVARASSFLFMICPGNTITAPARRSGIIGRFGIGLLSCFLVSDEIVVRTRSAKSGGRSLEWRGRADGTYSINSLAEDMPVGTQVRLLCKRGYEQYFDSEMVEDALTRVGVHRRRMTRTLRRSGGRDLAGGLAGRREILRDGVAGNEARGGKLSRSSLHREGDAHDLHLVDATFRNAQRPTLLIFIPEQLRGGRLTHGS